MTKRVSLRKWDQRLPDSLTQEITAMIVSSVTVVLSLLFPFQNWVHYIYPVPIYYCILVWQEGAKTQFWLKIVSSCKATPTFDRNAHHPEMPDLEHEMQDLHETLGLSVLKSEREGGCSNYEWEGKRDLGQQWRQRQVDSIRGNCSSVAEKSHLPPKFIFPFIAQTWSWERDAYLGTTFPSPSYIQMGSYNYLPKNASIRDLWSLFFLDQVV